MDDILKAIVEGMVAATTTISPELTKNMVAGTAIWAVLVAVCEIARDVWFWKPAPYPHEDGDEWCVCEECLRKRRNDGHRK